MADETQDVPTFFANIVTSNLTTDELSMELRRVDRPHKQFVKAQAEGQPLIIIAAPTPEEIMSHPPVARIVVTFSAAKMLKQYLDVALPRAEEARKIGGQIE